MHSNTIVSTLFWIEVEHYVHVMYHGLVTVGGYIIHRQGYVNMAVAMAAMWPLNLAVSFSKCVHRK